MSKGLDRRSAPLGVTEATEIDGEVARTLRTRDVEAIAGLLEHPQHEPGNGRRLRQVAVNVLGTAPIEFRESELGQGIPPGYLVLSVLDQQSAGDLREAVLLMPDRNSSHLGLYNDQIVVGKQ